MFFEDLFARLKLRYTILFHYGAKNPGYIILKTICIILFVVPFSVYGIFNFILGLVLLIPSIIPIVGLAARLVCYISDSIHSIFFILITLADTIFESDNMKLIESLNTTGMLN